MARPLEEAFQNARQNRRAALIPYITAGFPRLDRLPEMVRALSEAGADIIEIGIPFSDPLADGPVLQAASTAALKQGIRIADILRVVGDLRRTIPALAPLVFLTYVNPVYRFGVDAFAKAARDAGVCGLIIPDLPWVEGQAVRQAVKGHEMAVIPLVAPTSNPAHLRAIRSARGFVYGVSVTGVTGARQSVDSGVADLVARVKKVVPLPVAIGFGISTPEQARDVGRLADGVIVGSALVEAIAQAPENRAAEVAYDFVRGLYRALERSKEFAG